MLKKKIVGHLTGKKSFEMDLDGHKITIDSPIERGGENKGPAPMQLVLVSLIGCIGISAIDILEKMRIDYDDLDIEVEADIKNSMPKVYENIHLIFKFKGSNLDKDSLDKGIALAHSNVCGVSKMLEKHTPVTYSIEINN